MTDRRRPQGRPGRERGFTLVELIIVLLIVGVLMAIGITTQRGSRTAVNRQDGVAAAHSLQKAVEAFRRDREGRVPSRPTVDWSGARGPVDQDLARPYMQAPWPEHVGMTARAGSTVLGSYTAVGGGTLSVAYDAMGPAGAPVQTTYRITVRDGATVVCVLGNDPAIGGQSC